METTTEIKWGLKPKPSLKRLSKQIGDWDATLIKGSVFEVKCTKCGLKGIISLPDTESRSKCPRCRKERLPLDQWQQYGFGALIPATPVKKIISASVDAVEEVSEISPDDDMVELGFIPPIVAGEDTDVEDEPDDEVDESESEDGDEPESE